MTITDDDILEGLKSRKPTTLPRDQRVQVLMTIAEVKALDEWRRRQSDMPPRSIAIRRLMGLRAAKAGERGDDSH
jgi:hypothetical protein